MSRSGGVQLKFGGTKFEGKSTSNLRSSAGLAAASCCGVKSWPSSPTGCGKATQQFTPSHPETSACTGRAPTHTKSNKEAHESNMAVAAQDVLGMERFPEIEWHAPFGSSIKNAALMLTRAFSAHRKSNAPRTHIPNVNTYHAIANIEAGML